MNTITVEIKYTVQPATGPNPHGLPFELIDAEGDRMDYVDSAQEAIRCVLLSINVAGLRTFELDLDGQVQ